MLRKGLGCNCVYTRFPIDSWWFWRITHFEKSVNILKKVNVNILNRIDKWKNTFCLQKISTQSIFPRNYLYCFSRDLDWDALGSKDIFVRFRIMFISKFYISLVREINITSFIECPFILNVITVTSLFTCACVIWAKNLMYEEKML